MPSSRQRTVFLVFCGFLVSIFWSLFRAYHIELSPPRYSALLLLEQSSTPLLNDAPPPHPQQYNTDCALLLFGLPRSFESLVLPSIVEHVLEPNKQYKCDVFAHATLIQKEPPGRSGKGGIIDGNSLYLLKQSVHDLYANNNMTIPYVGIVTDSEDDFMRLRGRDVNKFLTTKSNTTKRHLYHPWATRTYVYPTTITNMARQWHSIESVWNLMEQHAVEHSIHYKQIAMLRSDVFYATPIDINGGASNSNNTDNTLILPGFAMYPINDRMVIGSTESVKIWATSRYSRIHDYVKSNRLPRPGMGMHSEHFLNNDILPTIVNETNATIVHDANNCFWRVRADQSVWINDCDKERLKGSKPLALILRKRKEEVIQGITGMKCKQSQLNRAVIQAECQSMNETRA